MFMWDFIKLYKVYNFGLKAEIHWLLKQRREIRWSLQQRGEIRWSLKRRGRSASHSSKPVSSPVCSPVTTEEIYVWTLSNCIPTSHKRSCRRIEIWIMFYISTSLLLFVQQFNMQHKYCYVVQFYINHLFAHS